MLSIADYQQSNCDASRVAIFIEPSSRKYWPDKCPAANKDNMANHNNKLNFPDISYSPADHIFACILIQLSNLC